MFAYLSYSTELNKYIYYIEMYVIRKYIWQMGEQFLNTQTLPTRQI